MASALGGLRFEPHTWHEGDNWVVVGLRVTGRVSGVDIPQGMWQAIRGQDDRPIWWGTYRTEREALEAVESDP